jgi:hypothetical protein
MGNNKIGLLALVAGLGLGGCATMDEFGSAGRHVIGSLDTRRVVTDRDRPKLNDLMASLSVSDLSALR